MLEHQPSPATPEAEYLKSLSLLYVEDDDEIRDQLAQILRRRVGTLYTAPNGQEGLDAYRRHAPDMIITDILMPVMDGLTMAQTIRENDRLTPIIVTTAFERSDYLMRSIDVGVDKYVIKPVRRDLLVEALHKCANSLRSAALLRESEERYRMMFQSFRVGICIVTPPGDETRNPLLGGHVRDCNDAFLSLTGYSSFDELRCRPYADLIPADQHDTVDGHSRDRLLHHGFLEENEREFLRADGSRVPTLVQSILRRDSNHRPCELWELVSDIAEQKRANEQLHLAARVFENSGEGIIITDSECCILTVNRAFAKITGYGADEAIGQNPKFLASGLESPAFYEQMWATIHQTGYWQGELWNRNKNGDIYPEWLSITAIIGPEGKASHYIGIFSDISERKEVETRLLYTIDELTRSNTELERFAYVASHDLQEPLRNVVAFCQLLDRQMADRIGPDERATLDIIISGARRMRDLVHDLLEYSRAGYSGQHYETVSLAGLTALAADSLRAAIDETGATITITADHPFRANPVPMAQVIQNLIGNAIKFRQPDTPPVIRLAVEAKADGVVLSVADNGVGIDAEFLEQVFVIFKRVHRPADIPGTGIGLAICRRVVETHGGRIWAESAGEGRGTTFFIHLPHNTGG